MITWREAQVRIGSGGTLTLKELDQVIASSGGRTAAESDRLFQACPEWVARDEAREARHKELEAKFRAEEELLVADIRRAGYRVESVWDFVNTADSYPNAIPVLLNHLQRPFSDRTREGIARALTVREARGIAGRVIVDVLRDTPRDADEQFRWSLANALTLVATRAERADIEALIAAEGEDEGNIVLNRLKRSLKTAAKP